MKISDIMTRAPACCTPDTSLQEAAEMMCEKDCGEIPVVENSRTMKPVGVVTDRDIACRAVAEGRDPRETTVADCMSSPAVTATEDEEVDEACETMAQRRIRRLPVVDEKGACCGMVSQADIARKVGAEKAGQVVHHVSQHA